MEPKISINLRYTNAHPDNISFKNKRRRKLYCCSSKFLKRATIDSYEIRRKSRHGRKFEADKTYKLTKYGSRLNSGGKCFAEESTSTNCKTNISLQSLQEIKRFQKQTIFNDSSDFEKRNANEIHGNHVENFKHFIANKSCFQHDSSFFRNHRSNVSISEQRKPQERDFVDFRKLFNWTTTSSVRKLLPIFILVNMLPFLYAGESFVH